MRLLPYGEAAYLVELPDLADVIGYAAAVRNASLPAVVDVVPAARTVLVTFDPAFTPADAMASALESMTYEPRHVGVGPLVEISVRYDGPDLADVASLTGISVAEVIDRHTRPEYVVAFCGFSPGFAYCAGGDPALFVARLATPRSRVPEGAVAVAGEWTGVYPRSSPGGWRLLGRTEAPLWDLNRDPPALLTPGTRVRFTAVHP
jgi:KipI family sensor histidine kinase inhibitor